MRQVVLDTETTGLEVSQDHRIIEIGCVELVNRRLSGRHYHQYINPDRDIDAGAESVHGISRESLMDKPKFELIAEEFLAFIDGAELIIHNAPFDLGFLNHELSKLPKSATPISNDIIDTLLLARRLHPGQKNNLDALCRRYGVDNSQRELHGALLDAEILADVYLTMTGGQVSLGLGGDNSTDNGLGREESNRLLTDVRPALKVIMASEDEVQAHREKLAVIDKASEGSCLWLAKEGLAKEGLVKDEVEREGLQD